MFDDLQKPLLRSKKRKTHECVVSFNETSHNKRAQTKVKKNINSPVARRRKRKRMSGSRKGEQRQTKNKLCSTGDKIAAK